MADEPRLENDVRAFRDRLGWAQDELARRSGLSRAGISAIETGRLVPSTGAALALARAFGCTVEDLFRLPRVESASTGDDSAWAWTATQSACRYWRAEVNGITRAYPVEFSPLGLVPHDGTFEDGNFRDHAKVTPAQTLVIACCDPAAGLIVQELAKEGDNRLIVLQRSSHAALDLLEKGLIHAAGVHLARADEPGGNLTAVREFVGAGTDHRLLRVADWDEGIALAPGLGLRTIEAVIRARLRWVCRESGSGAQQCLYEVLGAATTKRLSRNFKHASDHRGVAEAIRGGWADAGICLRLTSLEANLDFLSVRREAYDLCFPAALAGDSRVQALIRVIRSSGYRRLLSDMPGYDTTRTGDLQRIGRRETGKQNPPSRRAVPARNDRGS
jgi:molybdate-binding protein/transcriptional regulator with XRE-family HTH domain